MIFAVVSNMETLNDDRQSYFLSQCRGGLSPTVMKARWFGNAADAAGLMLTRGGHNSGVVAFTREMPDFLEPVLTFGTLQAMVTRIWMSSAARASLEGQVIIQDLDGLGEPIGPNPVIFQQ